MLGQPDSVRILYQAKGFDWLCSKLGNIHPNQYKRDKILESVDIIPAKLHMQTAIITPAERIRISSLLTVDRNVDICSGSDVPCSTGKPSRSISLSQCSSHGFDNPRSHLETAFPDMPSIVPSSACVRPCSFLFCAIRAYLFSM